MMASRMHPCMNSGAARGSCAVHAPYQAGMRTVDGDDHGGRGAGYCSGSKVADRHMSRSQCESDKVRAG
jgi:hypothetical protein